MTAPELSATRETPGLGCLVAGLLLCGGLGLGWVVAGGVYGQSHEELAVLTTPDGMRMPAPAWYQLASGMFGVLPTYLRVVVAGGSAAIGLWGLGVLGAWWSSRERARRDAQIADAVTLDAERWKGAQVAPEPPDEAPSAGPTEGVG